MFLFPLFVFGALGWVKLEKLSSAVRLHIAVGEMLVSVFDLRHVSNHLSCLVVYCGVLELYHVVMDGVL